MPTFPIVSVEVAFPDTPFTVSKTWTNIAPQVRAGRISSGRRRELERFAAGTSQWTVNTEGGLFDPADSGSPYNGQLRARKPLRATATWAGVTYPLCSHFTEDFDVDYKGSPTTAVPASDSFALLADAELKRSPYAATVAARSPKAWWRLAEADNPSSTTVAADSASGAHAGVYSGPVEHGRDVAPWDDSNGVDVAGGGSVELPAGASMTGQFTIEGTFKTATLPAAGATRTMFAQGEHLLWNGTAFYNSDRSIRIYMTATGQIAAMWGGTAVTTVASHHDNVPHLVTFKWDGTTLKLTVDGVSVSTTTVTNTGAKPQANITIGRPQSGTDGGWIGGVQDWSVYDVALTDAEIAAGYQAWLHGWAGDTSGVRLARLMDLAGIPIAGDRLLDTGNSTLAGTRLNTNLLEEAHKINDTEDGLVFVDGDGRFRFIQRHARLFAPYTVSQATFYDDDPSNPAGALMYEDAEPGRPLDGIRNHVELTPEGGTAQIGENAASVTTHGRKTYSKTTQHQSNDAALDAVNWILQRYADPPPRVSQITLTPYGQEATMWPQILGRKLGDRITVVRHLLSGATLTHQCHIEGIDHDFDGDGRWVTTWRLSPADSQTYWVMGDATLSILGSTTRLAA